MWVREKWGTPGDLFRSADTCQILSQCISCLELPPNPRCPETIWYFKLIRSRSTSPTPAPPQALPFSAEETPLLQLLGQKICLGSSLTLFFLNLQNTPRMRSLLILPHYCWVQTAPISRLDQPHSSFSGLPASVLASPQPVFNTEARGIRLILLC